MTRQFVFRPWGSTLMNKAIDKLFYCRIVEVDLFEIDREQVVVFHVKRRNTHYVKITLGQRAELISREEYSRICTDHAPKPNSLSSKIQEHDVQGLKVITKDGNSYVYMITVLKGDKSSKTYSRIALRGDVRRPFVEITSKRFWNDFFEYNLRKL